MSLSVYTNEQDLLQSKSTLDTNRLDLVDVNLLTYTQYGITFVPENRPDLELHVYGPEGSYLTGNHYVNYNVHGNQITQGGAPNYISVDLNKQLADLGITRGQYKIVYNLFNNVVGTFNNNKLWIKEISPSRREIRLQFTEPLDPKLNEQYNNFFLRWAQQRNDDVFNSYVLNFGFNETYQIINAKFRPDPDNGQSEIVLKLYKPLAGQYSEKNKLWISEEIIVSFADYISIVPKHIPKPVTNLAPPNFDLEEYEGGSVATDYQSWNTLLSSNIQTSQQLIDAHFSGSLSGIKLNTNFRLFDNFVHFSSAEERVLNFKYKLELIESFSDRIKSVSKIIGGDITQVNLSDLYRKRNNIVSSFDDFEKYLFFESTGSRLYTHYDTSTGSIDPWPKTEPTQLQWNEAYVQWSTAAAQWNNFNENNLADPFTYFAIQVKTTSATGQAYFYDLLEKAQIYDRYNPHALRNAVPEHLLDVAGGDEFQLFVDMIGQHFDILWTYIKALTSINSREEHPKDGMPSDLLYNVAKSMGFELLNGRAASDLWRYALALDENGIPLKSEINRVTVLTDEENTKETWRRLVNNLPYILKTKGTARAIKALVTCFGIPTSVLTIKEYGGPSTFTDEEEFPEYVHNVFHYAWYSYTSTGSLELPLTQYLNASGALVPANTLEFRFKTDNNFTYGTNYNYNIVSISSGSVEDVYQLILTKDSNDDNEGTLTLFNRLTGAAVSASNLEIFDNSWHTVALISNNNTGSFYVSRALYGKTIYTKYSEESYGFDLFPSTGSERIVFTSGSRNIPSITLPNATTVSNLTGFNGHFQEVRLWSGSFGVQTISEHANSPATYTFNVDRATLTAGEEASKPFDHLLQRYSLSYNQVSGSASQAWQVSQHPNQKANYGRIYFTGFFVSSSIEFESFEETYYTPSPSLAGQSLYAQKIRIESSSLDPNRRLNTNTRIEKSSYDRHSLDSNRLGVYFSPQTAINEDIFNNLGYFEIDDYIGDPENIYKNNYPELNTFAINYWKKYDNRNDFEQYFRALQIYDFTLFKYIKRVIPARVNGIIGLVVEPNVLERNKVRIFKKPSLEDLSYQAEVEGLTPIMSGDYLDLPAVVDWPYPVIESTYLPIEGEVPMPPQPIGAYTEELTGLARLNATLSGDFNNNSEGIINGIIDTDRLGIQWIQHRYIGSYRITETGSYVAIQTTVLNGRLSTFLNEVDLFYSSEESASLHLPFSSSLTPSQVNYNHGLGYLNITRNGCRLSGPGVNINSTETSDGGPVIKVTQVNPNRIVFSQNQLTTLNQSVTGQRPRPLTTSVGTTRSSNISE